MNGEHPTESEQAIRLYLHTSTRPLLHNIRLAEDSSGTVCVARERIDRRLIEGSRSLRVSYRKDEGSDKETCVHRGVNEHA